MMIQSSIITVLLVSTCFQSFSVVQAMEADEAAMFTQPFNKLTAPLATDGTGLFPQGGFDGIVDGFLPDLKMALSGGGSMGKRDESTAAAADYAQDEGTLQTSGQGVATYSDAPNEGGALQGISHDLLSQLKKRYRAINSNGELDSQDPSHEEQQQALVSLLNRRGDLGISQLLGTGNNAGMEGSESTVGKVLGGLRRRGALGLLGGNEASPDSNGGTTVSLLGRNVDNQEAGAASSAEDQQKTSGTHVSLLNLRRRDLLPAGLLSDSSKQSTGGTINSVGLLGKRAAAANTETTGDLGEQLGRRSTSVLSGAERMDRARQGVVVDSQGKSGMMDRRAVYAARDNDDDRRIIEDYQKLMKDRQEEYENGLQMPSSEQEKKGSTHISLANLRRRLVDGVVQDLAEKLALGGTTDQGSNNRPLLSDVTSDIQ